MVIFEIILCFACYEQLHCGWGVYLSILTVLNAVSYKCVQGVKTSSDRHIKHMGIFEFVDLLNEESKYVQKDQPTASPHEIAKYAFLEVVMHKRNGHGLLCHFDEAQHCVAFYDQTKKVCSIEYAALRELISEPYNMSDPSRMRPFLAIETLRADTQSVEQGSIGGETCDIHQTRRRRKKLFRHSRRYPKHRKRYKGFSCIDKYPDGCGSDDTTPPCDRVKKIFRKLIKGSRNPMEEVTENKLLSIASCGGSSKRSHELHIISSESSAYSSGDPSDVDNLTDVCSVCSSE